MEKNLKDIVALSFTLVFHLLRHLYTIIAIRSKGGHSGDLVLKAVRWTLLKCTITP